MAESGTLYNFGVLTKRYELVSRTAGQFAPGVLGAAAGFVMILGSVPMPLPFMPVLLGFWFAMGRMPFGRHRGTKVRALVGRTRASGSSGHGVRPGGRCHRPGCESLLMRESSTATDTTTDGATLTGDAEPAVLPAPEIAPRTHRRSAANVRPLGRTPRPHRSPHVQPVGSTGRRRKLRNRRGQRARTAATGARSAPLRGSHPRWVGGGPAGRAGGAAEAAHRGGLGDGRRPLRILRP